MRNMWFRKVLFICAPFAVAITLVIAYLFTVKPSPRFFYAQYLFGYDPITKEIWDEYEDKRTMGADWTRRPEIVALRLTAQCAPEAGPPVVDCSLPTKFDTYVIGEKQVVFVILNDPVEGDDSIVGKETRLDLKQAVDGTWDVEWVGMRWHCDEERSGFSFWTSYFPCS